MTHGKADLTWAGVRLMMAGQKRLTLPRKELPSATPERQPKAHVLVDERVPMRDGITLATDVYLPAGADGRPAGEAFPAILIRMPYGIREPYAYMPAVGRYWARRGYACVIQDVRGKFGSEGEWDPFRHEIDDGYDAIEWTARQAWCDGRVGMTGESYFGHTQWAAAASHHPALRCISPGDMGCDIYALIYESGALALGSTALWACDQARHTYINWLRFDTRHLPLGAMADAAGLPSRLFSELIAHPTRGAFWRDYDFSEVLAAVDVPVFLWSGWFDNMLTATLGCWRGMEVADADAAAAAAAAAAARRPRWFTLGPTDHETSPDFSGSVGRIQLLDEPRSWDRVLEFMDAVLREGDDSGAGAGEPGGASFAATPRVRVYVTGAGRWREADEWPLPDAVPAPYYLSGDGSAVPPLVAGADGDTPSATGTTCGRLVPDPPAAESPDRYAYDPLDPPNWWEGKDLWAAAKHLGDRRRLEERPDVLTYTGPVLAAPLEVVGPLGAVLWVSTTAPDTDFVVSLVDVWPDGYVQLVQQGIRRLRYRESDAEPALAEPGEIYRLEVALAATGYLFAASHQLRVEVASAEFDRWDRNPNTGHAFAADAATRIAVQTVYHDRDRPSHVVLPVIAAGG
jgi:putative CocE/NonD family hydrolase